MESPAPRADFPLLARQVNGMPLVYLDSGATSQRPQPVLDAVSYFETHTNSAVNRAAHTIAGEATVAYESARAVVADFVGADPTEIIWTKSSTESLNSLAYIFGNIASGARIPGQEPPVVLAPGDTVVVTQAEHHANLIPWQELCARTGAELRWLTLTPDARIDLESASVIDHSTKIVAFTHVSNVSGAISPVAELVQLAREVGALTVLDACQSVPHLPVNLRELGVDFAAFSGHKMLGPSGIGVLYGREELLAGMPPFLFGGSMVQKVAMEKTTYALPPARFEAGTQPVAQIVGLAAAAEYLRNIGMDRVAEHEKKLLEYTLAGMSEIPGIQILGPADAENRIGAVSFAVAGVHPHDVGQFLDSKGVAVRAGHHCAQPIHQHFGVHASTRASFGPYNTLAEIDVFLAALAQVQKFFGRENS
ncbi:MAG: cysteine desulfurase [Trueperella sp.]|nr:cysteine desulfurase [Trueperella sp.]